MNTVANAQQAPQLIDILRRSAAFLARHGVASARLDAEVLLADVLALDRIQLYVQHDRPLSRDELERYRHVLKRRARRTPVAYVTGRKEFMSLEFAVDERVLIPRPDTEVLVEAVCSRLFALGIAEPKVVDVGTGSGAIACAVSREIPGARVLGTDVSGDALQVAASNVARLGLEGRVFLAPGDLFEAIDGTEWERADALVSNPPYIPSGEIDLLSPEISRYEPRLALDGGTDGLDFYRRIAEGTPRRLAAHGFAALEVGDGQAEPVAGLLRQAGLVDVCTVDDYSGVTRVVIGSMASMPLNGGEGGVS